MRNGTIAHGRGRCGAKYRLTGGAGARLHQDKQHDATLHSRDALRAAPSYCIASLSREESLTSSRAQQNCSAVDMGDGDALAMGLAGALSADAAFGALRLPLLHYTLASGQRISATSSVAAGFYVALLCRTAIASSLCFMRTACGIGRPDVRQYARY